MVWFQGNLIYFLMMLWLVFIFLENPFDWMHRATDETTVAGAMIEVDVSCLELIGDGNIFWTDGYKLSDKEFFHSFIYKQVIPPDRFVRIFVSTDGKPSCFREYKL